MINKRNIKGEKHIASKDFAGYLRKSDVSENSIFLTVGFYEMDFMKGIVILINVDEICKILKSASHYLLVER